MHVQILSALVASAVMSVSAAPSSGLEARQTSVPQTINGYVYAQFFSANDCGAANEPVQDDQVIGQSSVTGLPTGLAGCRDLTFAETYPATLFEANGLTQTIRFFNKPCSALTNISGGSSTAGPTNFIDVGPDVVGCRTLPIRSYVTL